jgi:hypothetical protein
MASTKAVSTARRHARAKLVPGHVERFDGEELLTAAEIGDLLDVPPPFRAVKRWRGDGHLVAVPVAQGFLYPAFQIDRDKRRLDPRVVAFNRARRSLDPWTVLSSWYEHANTYELAEATHD